MLSVNKWEQYGIPREEGTYGIRGITIHEFDDSSKTAEDIYQFLNNESKENEGYHFAVDADHIVELMPLDYSVYHTGKYMDWGDLYTVAIVICKNEDDNLFAANVNNAIILIKDLMEEYDLTYRDIFFHIDFNGRVHCPDNLLNMYESSSSFAYIRIGIAEEGGSE